MHLWDKNAKECQQIAYRLSIWGKTNSESASYFLRHLLAGEMSDRKLHLTTLNCYRHSEQRSCSKVLDLIEWLQGKPTKLVSIGCNTRIYRGERPLPLRVHASENRYTSQAEELMMQDVHSLSTQELPLPDGDYRWHHRATQF